MEKEFKLGQMAPSMKVNGLEIKCVVKVVSFFPTETFIRVLLSKIWHMVKGLSSRQMGPSM